MNKKARKDKKDPRPIPLLPASHIVPSKTLLVHPSCLDQFCVLFFLCSIASIMQGNSPQENKEKHIQARHNLHFGN